jgi:lysophospholipase L1-like esterase
MWVKTRFLRAFALGLGLSACSASQETPPSVSTSAPAASSPPAAVSALPMASASAAAPVEAAAPLPIATKTAPPVGRPASGAELARFHAALAELAAGERTSHVRIAWLGDSHGQADFWSGALRDVLTAQWKPAGPGFLHAGYKAYRHEGVKVNIDGMFRIRPGQPSSLSRTGDGVFGLGGILTSAVTANQSVSLEVTGGAQNGLFADVCYRLREAQASLVVSIGGVDTRLEGDAEGVGGLRHRRLSLGAEKRIVLRPSGPEVDLCGVSIETDAATSPGIVVDTLGINGARYKTALAWDEAAWGAELSRRAPELLVLEYGTNEAGDQHPKPERYAAHIVELVERARKFAPSSDCVVLSLTDRVDTTDRNAIVRDGQRDGAALAGCAFWDTYQVMGGAGGFVRWRGGTKPLASPDGVHLTVRGYRELGQKLAADLLRHYGADAAVAAPAP